MIKALKCSSDLLGMGCLFVVMVREGGVESRVTNYRGVSGRYVIVSGKCDDGNLLETNPKVDIFE